MEKDTSGMDYQPEEARTYKTISGVEFRIKPISQYALNRLESSRKIPVVPLFKKETAGGGFDEMPYDEQYAIDHPDDPEVQANWNEYQTAVNEELLDYSKRLGRMIVLMGTEIEVPGMESDWQKEQEYLGFEPPTDPAERKVYYMLQSILTDDRDISELTGEVLSLGRVDMEYVRRVRESFQVVKKRKADRRTAQEGKSLEGEPVIQ